MLLTFHMNIKNIAKFVQGQVIDTMLNIPNITEEQTYTNTYTFIHTM